MPDKKNKAESKEIFVDTGSKRSYEPDPTLKGLAGFLKKESATLREEERESLSKISASFSKAICDLKSTSGENLFQAAKALAIAVEAKDPYTGGHSYRVLKIASEIGKRCKISAEEQLYLEGGALLHDVGKIAIRDGVLLKPGPLTDSEYKEMQLHPIIGSQMVKQLKCLQGCIDVVLLHHERMDGYGYPYGMKGKEIPLIARITSVVDAYDAMTTNRIYRRALNHELAIEEIMRNSGTQFDSEVVKIFVKWWEETFQHIFHPCKESSILHM